MLNITEYPTDPQRMLPVKNAELADATAIFAVNFWTPPMRVLKRHLHPTCLAITLFEPPSSINLSEPELSVARELYRFVESRKVRRLNVAGNSLATLLGAHLSQVKTNVFLMRILAKVHAHHPFEAIISGGNLGVEIGAAAAGVALEIPVTIAMPKGYVQRDMHGEYRSHSKDQIQSIVEMLAGGLRSGRMAKSSDHEARLPDHEPRAVA